MGWEEIRNRSRDLVHATFALSAVYTDPVTLAQTDCKVRLHNKLERFGDLDREGYAKVLEEINQAVFDSTEIVPKKKGLVAFVGSGEVYCIVNLLPLSGSRYIQAEVTRE